MATWVVDVTFAGLNPELEDELIAKVGKEPAGCGYGFGHRDIDWTFNSLGEAVKAAEALRRVGAEWPAPLRVNVREQDDEPLVIH